MKTKILFVLLVCVACTCESLIAQQGLSEADRQKILDAVKAGMEKGVKDAQDKGTISKEDADRFLQTIQESESKAEQRYKELQARKAAGPVVWKEFTSTEGGFSVLFPGAPVVKHFADENGVVNHSFTQESSGEDVGLSILCWEIPRNMDKRRLAGMLDLFRDKLLGTGTMRSERSVSLDGNPGKEFFLDFEKLGSSTQARIYQTKDRFFILLCTIQPTGAEFPPQAKKFFDSFALSGSASAQSRPDSGNQGARLPVSVPARNTAAVRPDESPLESPVANAKAGLLPNQAPVEQTPASDRGKTALRYLRAAHEIDETEITSEIINSVERALETWKGDKLDELIGELEALKENTTRNRKTFKRYWEAEGSKLLGQNQAPAKALAGDISVTIVKRSPTVPVQGIVSPETYYTTVLYTPEFPELTLSAKEYLQVVFLFSRTGQILEPSIVAAGGSYVLSRTPDDHFVCETEVYGKTKHQSLGRRVSLADLNQKFIHSKKTVNVETEGNFANATVSATVALRAKEDDQLIRFVTPVSVLKPAVDKK